MATLLTTQFSEDWPFVPVLQSISVPLLIDSISLELDLSFGPGFLILCTEYQAPS